MAEEENHRFLIKVKSYFYNFTQNSLQHLTDKKTNKYKILFQEIKSSLDLLVAFINFHKKISTSSEKIRRN